MRITVKVKANAKEEKISRMDDGSYAVSVKAPPKEGKANFAVADLLARYFSVPLSQVLLVSGKTSRSKVFEISSRF